MKKRKLRSRSEWLGIIQLFKSSGCTPTEFCQKQNLDYKYFLKRKRSLESKDSAFVKVQTNAAKQISPSTDLVLQYQDTRLHLSSAIDAQWLAHLMQSLS